MSQTQESKQQKKFHEIVSEIKAAMLVTRKADGALKSRPMMLLEATQEGKMTFITGQDTDKVDDLLQDQHVCVTFQHGGAFLSASGHATIDANRDEIHRLWSKANEAWFDGPDDPNVVLLQVRTESAEYWDNRGLKALKYAFDAVRAMATGGQPDASRSQHGTVNL